MGTEPALSPCATWTLVRRKAVRLQRIERRCCGLLNRCVVFLHRRERFTEIAPHGGSHLAESVEHMVLFAGLALRGSEQFARRAIHRLQRQTVLTTNLRNGPFQDSRAVRSQALFPSNLRIQSRVRRLAHHFKSLLDPLRGDDAQ